MKKLREGKWSLNIIGGNTSVKALLPEAFKLTNLKEQHKVKPNLHKAFHPTKGFGYRSRRGKRSNGTKRCR